MTVPRVTQGKKYRSFKLLIEVVTRFQFLITSNKLKFSPRTTSQFRTFLQRVSKKVDKLSSKHITIKLLKSNQSKTIRNMMDTNNKSDLRVA